MLSFIVVLFLVHPTLTNMLLKVFQCEEVSNGRAFMFLDFQVECYQGKWNSWAFAFVVPIVCIFSLGMPLYFLWQLRNRWHVLEMMASDEALAGLDDEHVEAIKTKQEGEMEFFKAEFVFLWVGYRDECRFWEFWALWRKSIIILGAVALSGEGVKSQALLTLFFMTIIVTMQFVAKPFKDSFNCNFNRLETLSLLSVWFTVWFGMFFGDEGRSQKSKDVILVCIMLFHATFLSYFLYCAAQYVSVVKEMIMDAKNAFCTLIGRKPREDDDAVDVTVESDKQPVGEDQLESALETLESPNGGAEAPKPAEERVVVRTASKRTSEV